MANDVRMYENDNAEGSESKVQGKRWKYPKMLEPRLYSLLW